MSLQMTTMSNVFSIHTFSIVLSLLTTFILFSRTSAEIGSLGPRKDINSLSALEIENLREAFTKVQQNGEWEAICSDHGEPNFFCPHGSYKFLPWHRRFLRRLEEALGLAVPYWDWTKDDVPQVCLNETYTHSNGQELPNPLHHSPHSASSEITEINPVPSFPNDQLSSTEKMAMSRATFEEHSDLVEEAHNTVHGSCGGAMVSVSYAAFAPIFWFNHMNVDRLWFRWQVTRGADAPYPPDATGTLSDSEGRFLGSDQIADLSRWTDSNSTQANSSDSNSTQADSAQSNSTQVGRGNDQQSVQVKPVSAQQSSNAETSGQDQAGQTFGQGPGQTSGKASGQTSGQSPGQTSGQTPGQTSGQESGQTSGQTPGQTSGQEPGQTSGQTPGQTSGQEPGQTSGQEPGQTSGQEPGQTSGQTPGQSSNSSSGQAPAQSSEEQSGQQVNSDGTDDSGRRGMPAHAKSIPVPNSSSTGDAKDCNEIISIPKAMIESANRDHSTETKSEVSLCNDAPEPHVILQLLNVPSSKDSFKIRVLDNDTEIGLMYTFGMGRSGMSFKNNKAIDLSSAFESSIKDETTSLQDVKKRIHFEVFNHGTGERIKSPNFETSIQEKTF